MRASLVLSLLALFCPAVALAQTTPATATSRTAPPKSGDITKDQYIERAVERAKRAAAARFERMDANHDGVLGAEERRAARAQRRAAPPQ